MIDSLRLVRNCLLARHVLLKEIHQFGHHRVVAAVGIVAGRAEEAFHSQLVHLLFEQDAETGVVDGLRAGEAARK